MQVENKTRWETRDLKSIASFCLSRFSYERIPSWRRKRLVIRFRPSNVLSRVDVDYFKKTNEIRRIQRPGGMRGSAQLGGIFVTIRVPNYPHVKELNIKNLGFLLMHELCHIAGYTHRDMRRRIWNHWPNDEKTWNDPRIRAFERFQIRPKQPKPPKPKLDQIVRYERALANLKRNKSKLKRYQNLVKKWNQKVRYYEKVLSVAGKIPPKEKG